MLCSFSLGSTNFFFLLLRMMWLFGYAFLCMVRVRSTRCLFTSSITSVRNHATKWLFAASVKKFRALFYAMCAVLEIRSKRQHTSTATVKKKMFSSENLKFLTLRLKRACRDVHCGATTPSNISGYMKSARHLLFFSCYDIVLRF